MKLIDFTNDEELLALRRKVGAPYSHQWSPGNVWQELDKFSLLSALEKYGEIDIPSDKITVDEKTGTLEVHGKKILVYIRDQYLNREYKFHVAHCGTLRDAIGSNRYSRYVASIKRDGYFIVNSINYGQIIKKDQVIKMKVCISCLRFLNYKNYGHLNYREQSDIYENFSIEQFFVQYPDTKMVQPKYTDLTAPLNQYSSDFRSVADKVKELNKYSCNSCGIKLDKLEHRKFLHVHHINGRKEDNSLGNLKSLCIFCHDKQPGHQLSGHPDYWEFKSIFYPELF